MTSNSFSHFHYYPILLSSTTFFFLIGGGKDLDKMAEEEIEIDISKLRKIEVTKENFDKFLCSVCHEILREGKIHCCSEGRVSKILINFGTNIEIENLPE